MPSLIMFCPEGFTENELRKEYGEDSFVLTALGVDFEKTKESSSANIQLVLNDNEVDKIIVVQNTKCKFVESFFDEEFKGSGVTAKEFFSGESKGDNEGSQPPIPEHDKRMTLALLNLRRQLSFVKEVLSDMGEKYSNIEVDGLVLEGK